MNLRLHDIKKDQVFYECERGQNIRMTALEDAQRTAEGWECRVSTVMGEIKLFEAHKCYQFGLRLYSEPQYVGGES